MTDPNAILYFPDPFAYAWKVDQLAGTDGTRDESDLLRYAATDPGGMYRVAYRDALGAVQSARAARRGKEAA